jgi:hypothetical protein
VWKLLPEVVKAGISFERKLLQRLGTESQISGSIQYTLLFFKDLLLIQAFIDFVVSQSYLFTFIKTFSVASTVTAKTNMGK